MNASAGAQPGSLPLLIYGHGGDNGEDLDQILQLLPLFLPGEVEEFVIVVPSFRSERLVFDGTTYISEGPASPWDRDGAAPASSRTVPARAPRQPSSRGSSAAS